MDREQPILSYARAKLPEAPRDAAERELKNLLEPETPLLLRLVSAALVGVAVVAALGLLLYWVFVVLLGPKA